MSAIRLERLGLAAMDGAARVHRIALDARLPSLAGLHTPEEDRAFFRTRVFTACQVWGALDGDALLGIVAFRTGWVDQLYVLPHHQRQGVGRTLLRVAQRDASHLSLWTFQRNAGARRFYEAHGFHAVRETDGSGNKEREPDVLYRWERLPAVTAPGRS